MRRLIQALIVLPLPGVLVAIWYAFELPTGIGSWAGLLFLGSVSAWLAGCLAARAFNRRVLRNPPAEFGRTPTIDDIGLGWLTPLGGGFFLAGVALLRSGDLQFAGALMIYWVMGWLFMAFQLYVADARYRAQVNAFGALSDFFRSRF
jgi:hypothetical protein